TGPVTASQHDPALTVEEDLESPPRAYPISDVLDQELAVIRAVGRQDDAAAARPYVRYSVLHASPHLFDPCLAFLRPSTWPGRLAGRAGRGWRVAQPRLGAGDTGKVRPGGRSNCRGRIVGCGRLP